MSYSIHWTSKGEQTFDQNIEYLEQEWNNTVINQFLDRVSDVLVNISTNPLLYPLHNAEKSIHRCIINGRIVLYYRIIEPSTIDILLFWNTSQNPDKLVL
jgi:plasmid stabilization system protein ParE